MAKTEEGVDPKPAAKPEPAPGPTVAELQAQLAARDAEIAKLKGPPVPPMPVPAPAPKPEDRDDIRSRLEAQEREMAKTRERLEIQDLATGNSLTGAQAAEVHKVMKTSPDLKVGEALIIAKNRNPEAWGAPDPKGAQGFHGAPRPGGGGPPPANPDPIKTLIGKAKTASTRLERDDTLKAICGAHMAAAQGVQHPALR